MNERMREPFHALMWKASIGYNDGWTRVDPEVLEKFAELIVKECLNSISAHRAEAIDLNLTLDEAFSLFTNDIKTTFGIS